MRDTQTDKIKLKRGLPMGIPSHLTRIKLNLFLDINAKIKTIILMDNLIKNPGKSQRISPAMCASNMACS
jgi:hypothetical protein